MGTFGWGARQAFLLQAFMDSTETHDQRVSNAQQKILKVSAHCSEA